MLKKQRKNRHFSRKLESIVQAIYRQRNDVATLDDLQYRAAPVDTPTLNEESRTIIATISTEQPVAMYDYRNGRMIDEVLVARGGSFPERVPLLDDHSRYGTDSVMGSGRSITLNGDRWRATLHFAKDAGQRVDQTWQLVRQGHVTDVSIGYRYEPTDYVDIPPGKSQDVQGRMWTAGPNRTLRVVTKWSGREISTTPIGADDQAKIGRSKRERGISAQQPVNSLAETSEASGSASRSNPIEGKMNPILDFLRKHGLGADVTDIAAALSFARSLSVAIQNELAAICRAQNVEFAVQVATGNEARSATTQPPATQGSATPAATSTTAPAQPQTAEQIRAERERAMYINQQRGNLPDDIVNRALSEGWDTNRINTEFAAARANGQGQRSAPLSSTAPAGWGINRSLNLQTLQAAMLLRNGLGPDSEFLGSSEVNFAMRASRESRAGWVSDSVRSLSTRGNLGSDEASRAWDDAFAMRNMSMIDFCAAALEVEGVNFNRFDRDEILQRSFSTASLNAIFTTNFNAQMLEGFMTLGDSTLGWVREADLSNFLTQERIQAHKFGKLKKVDRNQEIPDGTVKAEYETYKLARYAEKFTVDEMDIIDDRFGALDMTPSDMGEAAAELRPDLVYAILLNNPTLGQDSVALFHSTHGNLVASGGGLSSESLAYARAQMMLQTSNGRPIGAQARNLIVPVTDEHTALMITQSVERRNTTANTEYGTKNWANGKFNVVSDVRMDNGVIDPATDTTIAGQPGTFFLAADGGRAGIEVGYLRGTGRIPVVRRFTMENGRLGLGWMVIMYVAAKAIGYQGVFCSKA